MAPSVKLGKASTINSTPIGAAREVDPTLISREGDADWAAQQKRLATALEAQMRGEGPSLAEGTLNQATDRNLKQSFALARSGRGNQALAMRSAQFKGAEGAQDAAGKAALIRSSEQLGAQEQLGNVSNQARETERAYNTSQAALTSADNQFNAGQFNTRQSQEAELLFNTNQFNANARNTFKINQAELNTRLKVADMSARAQIQAAGIAASAAKYAANLGFISNSNNLGFQMDKWYQTGSSSYLDNRANSTRSDNKAGADNYKYTSDTIASTINSIAGMPGGGKPMEDTTPGGSSGSGSAGDSMLSTGKAPNFG